MWKNNSVIKEILICRTGICHKWKQIIIVMIGICHKWKEFVISRTGPTGLVNQHKHRSKRWPEILNSLVSFFDLFDCQQFFFIFQWFIQITMAVQYIHSQKILHRYVTYYTSIQFYQTLIKSRVLNRVKKPFRFTKSLSF